MRWIATTCALVALGTTAAACGGGNGAGERAATTTRTAAAPAPDPLERLRAQTEARCTEFTRDVLTRRLPRTRKGERQFFRALRRMERKLVEDLRKLDVPPAHAAAYRRALDARSRSLRNPDRSIEQMERAASKLTVYNPHACRYWGVRALGKEGVQFQSDQSSYCYEDVLAIEKATRDARKGRISKRRAALRIARTLRRSARLMKVEAPHGAGRRWKELRDAVDGVGDIFHAGASADTNAEIDRFNRRIHPTLQRAGAAAWSLGIGNCDFRGPVNDAIVATDPNRPLGAKT